jgi:hypothetical protein
MDEIPTPKELRGAARAATIVAYAVGLAGVAVGTLALREDDLATAVLLYVVTFAVGACLIGVATLVRAMAGLSARLAKVDADVSALLRDRPFGGQPGPTPGDWRHGTRP